MQIHKELLNKLNKFMPEWHEKGSDFQQLLESINESFLQFDKKKQLPDQAFKISEEEYQIINEQLQKVINEKKNSIDKLKEALLQIDKDVKLKLEDNDLESWADHVKNLITKKNIADKELLKNTTRIASLIANLHTGVLVENEDRQIIYTNTEFCRLFGIPANPNELLGMDCSHSAEQSKSLFKDPETFVNRINQLLKNKQAVIGDILELNDGRIFERDFVPVFVDNEYKGHWWNYADVTEKKKILTALSQNEMKTRLIMNSALDAIITIDEFGEIISWNPQAEKIFGWSEDQVLKKRISELIIPIQYRQAHEAGLKKYFKTGEGPVLQKLIELSALNSAGEEFPIELTISPFDFEGKVFFCSFIRDISNRKQAERALSLREEKFRSIIANMNLGLLEVDNEDVIQFCNQSFT